MRFSMRWMFAVTAYIALLAAAVGVRSQVLVDVVWAVTIIAIGYARRRGCRRSRETASNGRGIRRARGRSRRLHVLGADEPARSSATRSSRLRGECRSRHDLLGGSVGTEPTYAGLRGRAAGESTRSRFPDDEWSGDAGCGIRGVRCGGGGVSRNRQEESLTNRLLRPAGAAEWQSCPRPTARRSRRFQSRESGAGNLAFSRRTRGNRPSGGSN